MRRLFVAGLVAGASALVAAPCWADDGPDVDHLIANLTHDSDTRVRTQAALALGASKSDRAVDALCSGLGDSNVTVRIASADGLRRLRLGGADCLEAKLDKEQDEKVRSTIEKAIDKIVFVDGAKYYVSVGKTSDKTGRGGGEVDRMVRGAMARSASDQGTVALAPQGESIGEAKKRLARHDGLKAVFLSPSVPTPVYKEGNVTVKVDVAVSTYPEKNVVATYAVKLTTSAAGNPDPDTESELIKTAAGRAIEKFAKSYGPQIQ
jgi:ribosomal protein L31E